LSYFYYLLVLFFLIALGWVFFTACVLKRREIPWREVLFLLVNLFAAHLFVEHRFYFMDVDFDDKYQALMELRYSTPFQFRLLVPLLMRGVYSLTEGWLSLRELAKIFDLVAVVLAIIGFRRYLSAWVEGHTAGVLALLLYLVLPFHYGIASFVILFPYDLPSFAFIVWGLVFLREGNWKAYYPLFVAACLNRETAFLLPLGQTALYLNRDAFRTWAPHLAAQVAIWFGWWLSANYLFSHLAGGPFMIQISRNWGELGSYGTLSILASSFGYLWVPLLVFWKNVPVVLRRQLIVVPVFFCAMFVVGLIDEPRIWGELIPYVAAAGFLSFPSRVRHQ